MKGMLAGLLALLAGVSYGSPICQSQGLAVTGGKVIVVGEAPAFLSDDFTKDQGWSFFSYKQRLTSERKEFLGRRAMVVSNPDKTPRDTAFDLRSRRIEVKEPRFYVVSFDCASDVDMSHAVGHEDKFWNGVLCYDEAGTLLSHELFSYGGGKGAYASVRRIGRFPEGTASFALSFGADAPDVRPGNQVAYANVKVQVWQEDITPAKQGQGSFTSRPMRYSHGGFWGFGQDEISWKLSGSSARARFQVATAKDVKGLPGVFSAFTGPDGTANSWYEEDGAKLPVAVTSSDWVRYRCELKAQNGAEAVLEEVFIGGACDEDWKHFFECEAPQVRRISPSPEADGTKPVAVSITDDFGIDSTSLRVLADGKDVTADVKQTETGFTYGAPEGFKPGVHRLEVSVRDQNGKAQQKKVFFRIGKAATQGVATLRDDGMVLIDGKPFFPIGVYAVKEIKQNGFSYDKAFAELRSVGVNFVQTYWTERNKHFRRFMDMAGKHGMKVWVAGQGSSNDANLERIAWSLEQDIDNPTILAWYIGDDTASYNRPEQLGERTELVKDLAPQMLTVHADAMGEERGRYRAFAPMSLAFMPEIYPVHDLGKVDAETCVPNVIKDMEGCFADVRNLGLKARTIWPIIQYFQGYGLWKRFPTNRELRAMSYAAIVSGAQGITWYTYNTNPKTKNRGVTANAETWKNFSTLTKEISKLSPVLTERAAKRQLTPVVLEGAKANALGGASVIALTKIHQGKTYLLTVNSALKPVKVAFDLPQTMTGKRIYEKGAVTIEGNRLVESYGPYEVKLFELTPATK